MLTWPEHYRLCCDLTGTTQRKVTVPGPLLRAAGSIGDVAQRLRDFDFPLTRDTVTWMYRVGHLTAAQADNLATKEVGS